MDCEDGMVVSEKAIALWPYMGMVVERINDAAEAGNLEAYNEIVVTAGEMASRIRRVTTVNGLRVELQGMLWTYRREIRDVAVKRRHVERGMGRNGRTLAPSTLRQYESFVRRWPARRTAWKQRIREALREITVLSDARGKIYTRGGVSLRVINGGRYPAHVAYHTSQDSWRRVR
ncbi:conserved hypothetical protein [delta proteobacterium NaphS2]|nr:conserved hypothetical protein [delta proteobacterium NaphS2]